MTHTQADEIRLIFRIATGDDAYSIADVEALIRNNGLERLKRLRLLTLLSQQMDARALTSYLPQEVTDAMAAARRLAEIRSFLQWQDLAEITGAMKSAGIPCLLIKGASVQWRLHEEPSLRCGKDIDFLVPRERVPDTKCTMHSLGFIQSKLLADGRFVPAEKEEIDRVEGAHYELAFYARRCRLDNLSDADAALLQGIPGFEYADGAWHCYSVVDIHWNLHFSFPDRVLLESCISEEVQGLELLFLRPEWEILYSAFKMYFESFDHYGGGLHFYKDILLLIKRYAAVIDWNYFSEQVQKQRLEACCYYVFRHIAHLLPPEASALLESWELPRPHAIPADCMDFGDFMGFAMGMRIAVTTA